MKAKPLDHLGFPKHELLEDGTILQTNTGRILSKPTDTVYICTGNSHKSYCFAKVLYCAQNDIHISKLKGRGILPKDNYFFTPEKAQTPPPDYKHYTGDLDFIGLPGYTLYIEGVYKKDSCSIQRKERHGTYANNPNFTFYVNGERLRLSAKKLQWCADTGTHYSKVHGHIVCVTPDGNVMLQDDYCRWLNDRYKVKKIDTVVSTEERLRRMELVMKETELLHEATTSGDYSKVAAYTATLEKTVMLHVWNHVTHFSVERRKAIWSYTYDTVLILARNGMICGHSIEHTARNVAHKASFLIAHGDGMGGTIRFTDKMIRTLHNEDDELPYQYD